MFFTESVSPCRFLAESQGATRLKEQDAAVCPKSQVPSEYCAYSHFSEMLNRTKIDWDMAMLKFEVYFDDSGTDHNSDIAVAACYTAPKRSWDDFVEPWDRIRREEGFEVFHMAEFVAKPECQHKPFCYWDKDKKERVYKRVASTINVHKSIGFSIAVPKREYDQTSDDFRDHHGQEHYTFAVLHCLKLIEKWRRESNRLHIPMQYIFDWEMQKSRKRVEIESLWNGMHPLVANALGTNPVDGYSFQHKECFKPLQAADVLAWQMKAHMEKILPFGKDREELTHPGFRLLRQDQEMELAFFTPDQIKKAEANFDKLRRDGFTVIR
ncbi:MAG TPA: DUF3800 domain-containing protein [Terriglobia bacterium]|nr:DUF3800 domain-containing protein [Terriglobia bacterium]